MERDFGIGGEGRDSRSPVGKSAPSLLDRILVISMALFALVGLVSLGAYLYRVFNVGIIDPDLQAIVVCGALFFGAYLVYAWRGGKLSLRRRAR